MKIRIALAAMLAALLGAFAISPQAAGTDPIVSYSKKAKFDDVRDFLKIAIENRSLVIDYHSHIHNMLERTGKDLGTPRKIFVNAEAFTFCSAVYSRKMMEADPHTVAFCPYAVTVYTTVQEPDKVYVAYQRVSHPGASGAAKAALAEVDKLLDGIAREALNLK